MNDKVKLKLRRDHYVNGVKKRRGTVIKIERAAAEWLLANRVAEKAK